jgi:hypothetical protein
MEDCIQIARDNPTFDQITNAPHIPVAIFSRHRWPPCRRIIAKRHPVRASISVTCVGEEIMRTEVYLDLHLLSGRGRRRAGGS